MAVTFESFSLLNPNPKPTLSSSSSSSPLFSAKKAVPMMALRLSPPPSSLRFDPLLRLRCCRAFASPVANELSLRRRSSVLAFAASHEDSKHSEIDVEKEKDNVKSGAEGSQEAWREALESFKEQALRIQCVSQEAYEIYSKKAFVILKETSKELKIQADKARQDLSELAKELGEDGKEYLTTASEKSPEVKEIVETLASSTDDLTDVSTIHDFRVGIPYGLLLSVGGFLSFMVTGSISSIRFGVILGGALLALSVSSLRAYKRGEKSPWAVKGQAAIASILFLRDARLFVQRSSFFGLLATVVSGVVAAFYIYRITRDGKLNEGSHFGEAADSE